MNHENQNGNGNGNGKREFNALIGRFQDVQPTNQQVEKWIRTALWAQDVRASAQKISSTKSASIIQWTSIAASFAAGLGFALLFLREQPTERPTIDPIEAATNLRYTSN